MLTHKGTQTIHTKRLTLRRFTIADAETMYATWASDERVARYVTWQPHESAEATRQLLDLWCAAYEDPRTYNWAMEYDGVLIGNISVVHLSENSDYADLGYCMGHAYWNKGLMSEAAKAVIDYLFAEVGVNRIGISHVVKNPASGRVAQKCGLTYEGTKQELFKAASGEFLDVSDYRILRREWESARRYRFWGWEGADAKPVSSEYPGIKSPIDLYNALSHVWCAETCAPRMRDRWTEENMTLGQCSITAFLAQDIFGGDVYGILRPDGNYHCYNVVGDCQFDLTSEQFGDEVLTYQNNPKQFREVHFTKEEKRLRYEYLKAALKKYCMR